MKKILYIVLSGLMVFMLGATPVFADADIFDKLDPSPIPNYDTVCHKPTQPEGELQEKVRNILNAVYLWIGIIAVIAIIIGGVKYMTSQGDASKIKSAKDTILYAIIGLIVALLAFAITNFILGALGA